MPRRNEPVKVSARPPWLDARAPFWKHQFVGGNVFMLRLLANHAQRLDANASPQQFAPMITRAREQLRRAARLEVTGRRETNAVVLHVTVENLAGHKFPTGHPYRRAWLHVRVTDARQRVLFESGGVDKTGAIRGVPAGFTAHRDVITRPEEVQIYQAVMADMAGEATWSLLRGAAYLKDNRLPPRGFMVGGPDAASIAIRGGAEADANFNAGGSGRDEVTYRLALPPHAGAARIEVELLYQAVPPETVARLLTAKAPAAAAFARLYSRADTTPEVVQRQRLEL